MKHLLYLLLTTLLLFSCRQAPKETGNSISADTIRGFTSRPHSNTKGTDTIVTWDDPLFADLRLIPQQISKQDFETYCKHYKPACNIAELGLSVITTCNDVCETCLTETGTGKKMRLPAGYDSGFSNLLFSSSCNQFIIYASYDSPDYEKYYEHRAGIRVFTITKDQGLKAVKPIFKFDSNDWSIEELTWINDKTIAVKVYEEARAEQGIGLHYKYYKMELHDIPTQAQAH